MNYLDGTNHINGKGVQLQSPTPIMAPGRIIVITMTTQ